MFNLETFAKDVHKNAVEHGWWDGERKKSTIRALIVSECSEALEEARAGRPMVWHKCMDPADEQEICERNADCPCKVDMWECDCAAYDAKPEGIAVELIDACIRILDYLEHEGCMGDELLEKWEKRAVMCALNETGEAVGRLELDDVIDLVEYCASMSRAGELYWLSAAFGIVWLWVKHQGLNPETIIQQKHRYNKTRPYKHGKKF